MAGFAKSFRPVARLGDVKKHAWTAPILVRGAGAETARLLRRAHRADNY
jgi:hypothetical protein